jgi:hypothetical protein
MTTLHLVLRELHRSETSLGRELIAVAERHRVDHEIFHVARDLAVWPRIHVRRLAEVSRNHGVRLRADPRWSIPALNVAARRTSVALAHRPETGLLLVADLRRLHRKAAGVSLDWELLAQAAQAMRKPELLELSQSCHPQTLRVMRWSNAQLKVVSSQVIAS